MSYQDRTVDLIDRKFNLMMEVPEGDFWLELDRFVTFILEDEILKPYTDRMSREKEAWLAKYEKKLTEEIDEANKIRQELISKHPNLNDSHLSKPEPGENITEIVFRDPYFRSFALFDELIERVKSKGPTIWAQSAIPPNQDETEASRLISLLENKISEIPRDEIPEEIFLQLRYLRERHTHLRQEFKNECRIWPPASLDFLIKVVSKINPAPKRFESISQLMAEELDNAIEGIVQPAIDPEECAFHLRRVYERLGADISSTLAYYELIQRYKVRCMVYDRDRIIRIIDTEKRQKEDALTRDLALNLFDNGVSTLYRVMRGVHEYDLIGSSLFIEAKVYHRSDKKRLIDGISQLHSYLNGLETENARIRDVYYVMFRVGGPIYDWPEKIEMNRWTIYPITIDIGPGSVSGSRQPRTVEIKLEDIYSSLHENNENSATSGVQKIRIGILAYGSLIDDPGEEIEPHIIEKLNAITPFKIEFARSAKTRGGAPTLVPVLEGGVKVNAKVLVLDETVTLSEAMDMLYRRETYNVGNVKRRYDPETTKKDAVRLVELTGDDAFGLSSVLYTELIANIEQLAPDHLADLAIRSGQSDAGKEKRDGISYLKNAIKNDIKTPLTEAYKQSILEKTETSSLEEAWEKATRQ